MTIEIVVVCGFEFLALVAIGCHAWAMECWLGKGGKILWP
jgi:hypothetical protein